MSVDVNAVAAYLKGTNPNYTEKAKITISNDVITVTYENGETQTLKVSDINSKLSGDTIKKASTDGLAINNLNAKSMEDPKFLELVQKQADLVIKYETSQNKKDLKAVKKLDEEILKMGYTPMQKTTALNSILEAAGVKITPAKAAETVPAEIKPEILNDTTPGGLRDLVGQKSKLTADLTQAVKDLDSGVETDTFKRNNLRMQITKLNDQIKGKGGTPEIEAGILNAIKEADAKETKPIESQKPAEVKTDGPLGKIQEYVKGLEGYDAEKTTYTYNKSELQIDLKGDGKYITVPLVNGQLKTVDVGNEPKDTKKTAGMPLQVTNESNKKGAIDGKISDIKYDEAGKMTSVVLTSNKSGNTFTYELDEKSGAYLNKKEGKYYRLDTEGNLVRDNSLNRLAAHKTPVKTDETISPYIKKPNPAFNQELWKNPALSFIPSWLADDKSGQLASGTPTSPPPATQPKPAPKPTTKPTPKSTPKPAGDKKAEIPLVLRNPNDASTSAEYNKFVPRQNFADFQNAAQTAKESVPGATSIKVKDSLKNGLSESIITDAQGGTQYLYFDSAGKIISKDDFLAAKETQVKAEEAQLKAELAAKEKQNQIIEQRQAKKRMEFMNMHKVKETLANGYTRREHPMYDFYFDANGKMMEISEYEKAKKELENKT